MAVGVLAVGVLVVGLLLVGVWLVGVFVGVGGGLLFGDWRRAAPAQRNSMRVRKIKYTLLFLTVIELRCACPACCQSPRRGPGGSPFNLGLPPADVAGPRVGQPDYTATPKVSEVTGPRVGQPDYIATPKLSDVAGPRVGQPNYTATPKLSCPSPSLGGVPPATSRKYSISKRPHLEPQHSK